MNEVLNATSDALNDMRFLQGMVVAFLAPHVIKYPLEVIFGLERIVTTFLRDLEKRRERRKELEFEAVKAARHEHVHRFPPQQPDDRWPSI